MSVTLRLRIPDDSALLARLVETKHSFDVTIDASLDTVTAALAEQQAPDAPAPETPKKRAPRKKAAAKPEATPEPEPIDRQALADRILAMAKDGQEAAVRQALASVGQRRLREVPDTDLPALVAALDEASE